VYMVRIIPARAGNTRRRRARRRPRPDHPRAGGEHSTSARSSSSSTGSSPRGRRTRGCTSPAAGRRRIIPARAENTLVSIFAPDGLVDHPRAGGEHPISLPSSRIGTGSSPRGQGTHSMCPFLRPFRRIIPARAGNTYSVALVARFLAGSSPRGRGTPIPDAGELLAVRIIPARAGNTSSRSWSSVTVPDHPRAGGEHSGKCSGTSDCDGSSPRGRGTP